jgi:hypothetical protein
MRQNNVMVSVSMVQARAQNSTVHKPGCRHSDSEYCLKARKQQISNLRLFSCNEEFKITLSHFSLKPEEKKKKKFLWNNLDQG